MTRILAEQLKWWKHTRWEVRWAGRNCWEFVDDVLLWDYRYLQRCWATSWTQETAVQVTDWETDLELLTYGHWAAGLTQCSKGATAAVGGRSSETESGGSPTRPRWLEEEEPTKETVERQHWWERAWNVGVRETKRTRRTEACTVSGKSTQNLHSAPWGHWQLGWYHTALVRWG